MKRSSRSRIGCCSADYPLRRGLCRARQIQWKIFHCLCGPNRLGYKARNPISGSTFTARSGGIHAASTTTASSNKEPPAEARGSLGVIPQSWLSIRRKKLRARGTSVTVPVTPSTCPAPTQSAVPQVDLFWRRGRRGWRTRRARPTAGSPRSQGRSEGPPA